MFAASAAMVRRKRLLARESAQAHRISRLIVSFGMSDLVLGVGSTDHLPTARIA